MVYRIEPAGPEHIPGICQAHREAVLGIETGSYTADELAAWAAAMRPEKMHRALAEKDMTLLVAVTDRTVAGFVFFSSDEVKALYVRPEHGRQGLGGRLLAAAEQTCRQGGTPTLRLTASRNAVPFYVARGFRNVGQARFPLREGGVLDCVSMEKVLALSA